MLKLAAIQMVSSADREKNLKAAGRLLHEAAELGAKLLVLPENFACLSQNETAKFAIKETLGSGLIQDFLAEQAVRLGITIVGGTIPLAIPNSEKVYSASLVFDEKGQCIAHYNKIHLF